MADEFCSCRSILMVATVLGAEVEAGGLATPTPSPVVRGEL